MKEEKGKEEEREDEEGMRKRKGQQGRLTFLPWKPCVHFQNSNLRFSWKRKRLGFFCMLDCVIFFLIWIDFMVSLESNWELNYSPGEKHRQNFYSVLQNTMQYPPLTPPPYTHTSKHQIDVFDILTVNQICCAHQYIVPVSPV